MQAASSRQIGLGIARGRVECEASHSTHTPKVKKKEDDAIGRLRERRRTAPPIVAEAREKFPRPTLTVRHAAEFAAVSYARFNYVWAKYVLTYDIAYRDETKYNVEVYYDVRGGHFTKDLQIYVQSSLGGGIGWMPEFRQDVYDPPRSLAEYPIWVIDGFYNNVAYYAQGVISEFSYSDDDFAGYMLPSYTKVASIYFKQGDFVGFVEGTDINEHPSNGYPPAPKGYPLTADSYWYVLQ